MVNFRGIGVETSVTFSSDCTILFGDNGSGKSSVVDAAEFALRGRLSRRSEGGRKRRREVRNLITGGAPGVILRLSDGRNIRRGGGLKGLPGEEYQQPSMVRGFEYSPIAIRRQHIEIFWSLSDDERKEFFFDYLRTNFARSVRPEEIEEKSRELSHAQEELTLKRTELFDVCSFPSGTRPIPETTSAVDWWKRNVLDRHLSRRPNRGIAKKARELFGESRDALVRRNSIRGVLNQMYADSVILEDGYDDDVSDVLRSIADRVTEDFTSVASMDWISSVEIQIGDRHELRIALRTERGSRLDPTQVLSEANLDLLALLVLVEVHIQCATFGQERIMVLDDVFQSVDGVHRVRALEHLAARLKNWQVVLTVHDRLWLELAQISLSRQGRQVEIIELIGQGPRLSPLMRSTTSSSIGELRHQVQVRASSATMCAVAGRTLEEMCDELSLKLETSVTRRPRDRYSIGDMWGGVAKVLRKRGPDGCKEIVDSLEAFLVLRNLVGAHFNEWARGLSSAEALDFSQLTLRLWESVHCATCARPFVKFKEVGGRAEFFDFECGPDAGHKKSSRVDQVEP